MEASERDALDRLGYVVMNGVLDDERVDRLRAAFEHRARPSATQPDEGATGTRHVELLAGDAAGFEGIADHPRVCAAVTHVLRRPFRVLLLNGRDPRPGYGRQGLHTDWRPRGPSEPFRVVTALWLLDEFTERNGATRVVPGTHLSPQPLPKSMRAPLADHPDQRIVTATAGAVLVFNGHLWHGGTRNDSEHPRRVLQCQYVAEGPERGAQAD